LATGTTRLIIDTNILPNPATVVITAENKLGSDQSFALLQVAEPTTKRVLEEKMHESGQESVSMTEANELQRQTTERLEEHAESRTQGSIEMDKLVVEPKGEVPQITEAPRSRTVFEHEVLSFSATITSKLRPLDVKWFLNDQLIQPTSSEFGLSQSGDQFTLRVNDSSVSQNGKIKVTATNPGTRLCKIYIKFHF
jgi:hypothetical protein